MTPSQRDTLAAAFVADLRGESPALTCAGCGRTWAQSVADSLAAGALPVVAKYGQRWAVRADGSVMCLRCAPPKDDPMPPPPRLLLDESEEDAARRLADPFIRAWLAAAKMERDIVWSLLVGDPADAAIASAASGRAAFAARVDGLRRRIGGLRPRGEETPCNR